MEKNNFIAKLIDNQIIKKELIGRVHSTENDPTQVFEFKILLDQSIIVEIGEFIGVVDSKLESVIIGQIDTIEVYSMAGTHLSGAISYNLNKYNEKIVDSVKAKIGTIKFLKRICKYKNTFFEVNPGLPVYLLDKKGVKYGLELPDFGIPVGLLSLPSTKYYSDIPVYVNSDYLLGPEAAHFNMGGQSGYGKTAYILFLLKGIIEWSKRVNKRVGIVAFNVKKDDLLYIDQINEELTNEDKEIYDAINIPSEPFKDVIFYGTKKQRSDDNVATLRHPSLYINRFHWEWPDINRHIDLAIGPHEQFDDIQQFALQIMIDQNLNTFREVFDHIERFQSSSAFNIHSASWGKFSRIINGIYTKNSGLLGCGSHPLPYKEIFQENNILIIDINEIFFKTYTQRLIFGKIISDLRNLMERNELGIDRLIIVTDELGRYASKTAEGSLKQIRSVIKDISERGRSLYITLFGLEQYPSTISDDIIGNVSTLVYTRMKTIELGNQLYRGFTQTLKNIIPKMVKSIIVLDQDNFPDPILLKFPRPPCSQKLPTTIININNNKQNKKIENESLSINNNTESSNFWDRFKK